MKIFFCLCSLLYSLLGLAQNKPFIVDLKNSNEDASLNVLFDKIEYVSLETTPECLLKPGAYYYVTNKYIVAMNAFWQTYLFDRKTGKFIRGLDREGGGPDEYRRWIVYLNGLNEKRNILYANDIDKWKGYDIETGEMVDIIKKPSINNDIVTAFSPWAINSNQYIGNVSVEFCEK
ncbi:6-bladed beta-propeller, partial [uncultured Parabacteroides sp.]